MPKKPLLVGEGEATTVEELPLTVRVEPVAPKVGLLAEGLFPKPPKEGVVAGLFPPSADEL